MSNFSLEQGQVYLKHNPAFQSALASTVDYRGDITVLLRDGRKLEVFSYNFANDQLDCFLKGEPTKISFQISDIVELQISGVDTAKGKSWEDYQARKTAAQHA
jgi:hypothetical protein